MRVPSRLRLGTFARRWRQLTADRCGLTTPPTRLSDRGQTMTADDSAPAAAAGQEQGQSADVLITIRALLPNLAPVEQRVAQQVMKDPFGTAMQSISELARSCDTSATTIVRFCRAVGLRGYPELRIALAAAAAHPGPDAVAEPAHDIIPGDEPALIAGKIVHPASRPVTDTVGNLDIGTLVEVVDVLAGPR